MAYTYSDFEFKKFIDSSGTSFKGNKIPGIPKQNAFIELNYYHPSGLFASWETQYVDEVYVDNANSDKAWSYALSNFRLVHTIYFKDFEFRPFLGVNNVFNKEYIGAVRVNESNNRFFEPAPEINVYGGISLRWLL
jgi:iron complex outermembrane receptor protein